MRLAAGVLFLIGSLVRGSVSVLGLAFLIAGLLFELLVCFITSLSSRQAQRPDAHGGQTRMPNDQSRRPQISAWATVKHEEK